MKLLGTLGAALVVATIAASFVGQMLLGYCPVP